MQPIIASEARLLLSSMALNFATYTFAHGLDKISYLNLKKLPSSHHFLATLYFKIILNSPRVPALWCKGEVLKGGDPRIPANVCPIALTSTIGKLFHKIITSQYLLNNALSTQIYKRVSSQELLAFLNVFAFLKVFSP